MTNNNIYKGKSPEVYIASDEIEDIIRSNNKVESFSNLNTNKKKITK